MLLVDERDGPVLHLAGRIALGVDVRDLLQLERAFERDRIVDAAAEVEKVACGCGSAPAILRSASTVCSTVRAASAAAADPRCACARSLFARACRAPGRDTCASRCSATSWRVNALVDATPISGPGVRVERAVGLARRHAADDVADREAARACASLRAAPPACRRFRPTA